MGITTEQFDLESTIPDVTFKGRHRVEIPKGEWVSVADMVPSEPCVVWGFFPAFTVYGSKPRDLIALVSFSPNERNGSWKIEYPLRQFDLPTHWMPIEYPNQGPSGETLEMPLPIF